MFILEVTHVTSSQGPFNKANSQVTPDVNMAQKHKAHAGRGYSKKESEFLINNNIIPHTWDQQAASLCSAHFWTFTFHFSEIVLQQSSSVREKNTSQCSRAEKHSKWSSQEGPDGSHSNNNGEKLNDHRLEIGHSGKAKPNSQITVLRIQNPNSLAYPQLTQLHLSESNPRFPPAWMWFQHWRLIDCPAERTPQCNELQWDFSQTNSPRSVEKGCNYISPLLVLQLCTDIVRTSTIKMSMGLCFFLHESIV